MKRFYMKLIDHILIVLLCISCSSQKEPVKTVQVSETKGIDRPLEYIEVQWISQNPPTTSQGFSISDGISVRQGQVLSLDTLEDNRYQYRAIFPISLGANQSKTYEILAKTSQPAEDSLIITGTGLALKVANKYFEADLTSNSIDTALTYGPGQVRALMMKNHTNQVLKRTALNMHWSPNFRSTGRAYRTSSHLKNPDSTYILQGPLKTVVYQEGKVDDYPEIRLSITYEFYAGVPYFIYSSEVYMLKDVELFLLRNDEMTMDSLFTHIVYRDHTHGLGQMKGLYDDGMVAHFAKDPVDAHAHWLAFYNQDLNYGFGSIRLDYDNMNVNGVLSPLYEPHTKISNGSNGGKYWNRRLIHEHDTLVNTGSRYFEKNAYFLFDTKEDVSIQLDEVYARLNHPVEVVYLD